MDKMIGLTPRQKREWQNAERIRKHGSGMTPEEFEGREGLLEEAKTLNWAPPTIYPTPMKEPEKKKQKIMASMVRDEEYS